MTNRFKSTLTPRTLALLAMLVALQVVLSRFLVIYIFPWLRISLGFLPIAMAGMLLGPFLACLGGGLGDVIGFFLFPSGGYYFPGFTVTAMVTGLIYGLLLHGMHKGLTLKDRNGWLRILLSELMVTLVCYIVLNTLWVSILQGKAVFAILPARALKNIAQYPVNVFLILEAGLLLKRLPASLRLP